MKPVDVIAKWKARLQEFARVRARIDGAVLCREALQDFAAILDEGSDELLNLSQAARRSGYSREHLSRLVGAGKIPNVGRPHAPRVRVRDLPRKAGHLPPERVPADIPGTSKRQIVRSIVDAQRRSTR